MIDPEQCEIVIKLRTANDPLIKAFITFKQNGARLSGFRLKDGEHGLWLEPPAFKSGIRWVKLYFDENTERYKLLQKRTVELYLAKLKKADLNEVEETSDQINLDDISF